MQQRRTVYRLAVAAAALVGLTGAAPLAAQDAPPPTKEEIGRATTMIEQLSGDLKKYYYDSTYHGIDLETRKRTAIEHVNGARNRSEAFAYVAQFLADFNDSHTGLYGFEHRNNVHYGFSLWMVGDSCYIARVTPGSDAAAKGVARGDRVVRLDKNVPTRQNFHMLQYVYRALSPRTAVHLTLEHPDGRQEEVDVQSKVTPGRVVIDWTSESDRRFYQEEGEKELLRLRHRYHSYGDSVLVWRLPEFIYGDDATIDRMIGRAKQHRALVLDLRGDPGGAVSTLQRLIGSFFDTTIVSSIWKARDSTYAVKAKPVGKEPYRGMLVILVDGQSASAAELTARTMQIEGRAIIVGDRSAGAVQVSQGFGHAAGFTKYLGYGAAITIADVTMSDGSRLERVGVVPDRLVLPTGADMATGRDPQMATALEIVGMKLTPEQAARVIRDEQDDEE